MTPPDDLFRLRHLRDAAEKAVEFSSGETRRSLDDDELLRLALTKLVEIVGEAAKQVSEPTRSSHPESHGQLPTVPPYVADMMIGWKARSGH